MNDSRSLRSRPPHIGGGDTGAMDAFIGGAGVQTTPEPVTPPESAPPEPAPPERVLYPWDAPGVRADIAKVFNLRLPEPYLFKLPSISPSTPPPACSSSAWACCCRRLTPGLRN